MLARTVALRWDLVIELDANDWSRYLTHRQRANRLGATSDADTVWLANYGPPEPDGIQRQIIESQHCVKGFYIIGVNDCPVVVAGVQRWVSTRALSSFRDCT